ADFSAAIEVIEGYLEALKTFRNQVSEFFDDVKSSVESLNSELMETSSEAENGLKSVANKIISLVNANNRETLNVIDALLKESISGYKKQLSQQKIQLAQAEKMLKPLQLKALLAHQ